jgi:zinc protease
MKNTMKNTWIKSIILLPSLFFSQIIFSQVPENIVNIQHWETSNKAQVYYVNLPQLPIIDIDVIFRAGSAYDGNNEGIAYLTTQMIGESAHNLNADQIADGFDNVGAIFDKNTTKDDVTFHLRALTQSNELDPALKMFVAVLSEPNFGSPSFNRVKAQTLQTILQNEQTPSTIATQAFFNALYPHHPYGHPTSGYETSVKKLTPEMLLSFYKQYFVSHNAIVVITGNVSIEQAKVMAEKMSHRLPKGMPAPNISIPTNLTQKENKYIHYPASQTYIRMGEVAINRNNTAYFPLSVGNYILGGGVLVSRLFNDVRVKQGLTYNIQSAFIPLEQKGPFIIALQTRTEATSKAINLINKAITKFLQEGPTPEEVKAAKQNMIGSFPLQLDSNSAITAQVAMIAFYQLPLNYLDTYRDNVEQVNAETIKAAFNAYLHPNQMLTVTVGEKTQHPN